MLAQRDLKYELKMAEKERNRDKCHVPASCVFYSESGVGWRRALPYMSIVESATVWSFDWIPACTEEWQNF